MADPKQLRGFTAPLARPLPVLLLADVSGSMGDDGKIDALNRAVSEMLAAFGREDDRRTVIQAAVITFGADGARLHQPLTRSSRIQWQPMTAAGTTPLAAALDLAAQMIWQEYTLGVLLGIGGQGAVYAVQGQPRAVKILQTRSPYDRERLRGQITFVQGRPLDGLPLARPLEMLQAPLVGYVMELLTEMEPLDQLMRPPRDVPETDWYISKPAVCAAACGSSPGAPNG